MGAVIEAPLSDLITIPSCQHLGQAFSQLNVILYWIYMFFIKHQHNTEQ